MTMASDTKTKPHYTLRVGGCEFIPVGARDGRVSTLHLAKTWRTRFHAERFAAKYQTIGTIELGTIENGVFVFVAWVNK